MSDQPIVHLETSLSSDQVYQRIRDEARRRNKAVLDAMARVQQVPDLSSVRICTRTPYDTVRFLTGVHMEDVAVINAVTTARHWAGFRRGLVVGFLTSGVLCVLFLLVTS